MSSENKLNMKEKIKRFNKVKLNLETEDFKSMSKAAACLRDNTVIGSLARTGLVKTIKSVHHWVGGTVTKAKVDAVYANARSKTYKKNTAKTVAITTTKKNTPDDSHVDLAEEISSMVSTAIKKELEPLITSIQCMQRHLDVIATKINIDLS